MFPSGSLLLLNMVWCRGGGFDAGCLAVEKIVVALLLLAAMAPILTLAVLSLSEMAFVLKGLERCERWVVCGG